MDVFVNACQKIFREFRNHATVWDVLQTCSVHFVSKRGVADVHLGSTDNGYTTKRLTVDGCKCAPFNGYG